MRRHRYPVNDTRRGTSRLFFNFLLAPQDTFLSAQGTFGGKLATSHPPLSPPLGARETPFCHKIEPIPSTTHRVLVRKQACPSFLPRFAGDRPLRTSFSDLPAIFLAFSLMPIFCRTETGHDDDDDDDDDHDDDDDDHDDDDDDGDDGGTQAPHRCRPRHLHLRSRKQRTPHLSIHP